MSDQPDLPKTALDKEYELEMLKVEHLAKAFDAIFPKPGKVKLGGRGGTTVN